MIRFVKITIDGPFPGEKQFRRKHGRAMKAGHRILGEHWLHGGVRERHFEPAAHFRYGYAPRSLKYQAAKKKKQGHNTDLVWSGESERQTSYGRVVPSAKRALMKVPMGKMNFKKGTIDMRDELFRLRDEDRREMARAFLTAYKVELVRQRGGRVEMIRAAA